MNNTNKIYKKFDFVYFRDSFDVLLRGIIVGVIVMNETQRKYVVLNFDNTEEHSTQRIGDDNLISEQPGYPKKEKLIEFCSNMMNLDKFQEKTINNFEHQQLIQFIKESLNKKILKFFKI